MFFKNKSVLITGGTGSFGKKFVEKLSRSDLGVRRLIIYSRDELKQSEMRQMYPSESYPNLRFFIGDVRDYERLKRATSGVDCIIHAAAMKQVDTAEYNPDECVKTNVGGAENVIKCALENNVSDVVALSTDKACAPINLYGATKLVSDKLFIAANNLVGQGCTKFSVVRYGNVIGSRGSVIPFFMNKRRTNVLPITHPQMTRFSISLDDGVAMVMFAFDNHLGGEIFVPKIPSYNILDVADAIAPGCEKPVVGIRPGEKMHEEMISVGDALSTIEFGSYYAILPAASYEIHHRDYVEHYNAKFVPTDFCYNSGSNNEFLSIDDLRTQIREHIDPDFSV